MPATIRLATPADAGACLAIYRPFVEATPVTFEREVPGAAEFAGRMDRVLAQHPWLVCEDDGGAILGYAYATYYRPRPAYQWGLETTIYMAPEARGRGLARVLYADLLDCLRGQGVVNAYAGIALPNPDSVRLHERLGFTYLGTYEGAGYKLGAWHDVGWWQLALQPRPAHPREPIPFPQIAAEIPLRQPE